MFQSFTLRKISMEITELLSDARELSQATGSQNCQARPGERRRPVMMPHDSKDRKRNKSKIYFSSKFRSLELRTLTMYAVSDNLPIFVHIMVSKHGILFKGADAAWKLGLRRLAEEGFFGITIAWAMGLTMVLRCSQSLDGNVNGSMEKYPGESRIPLIQLH